MAKKQKKMSPLKKQILEGAKIRAKFTNVEDPNTPLEFTLEGVRFFFEDGKEYDMPVVVFKHLNSITIPDDKWEMEEVFPGKVQLKGVRKGVRHRFSCIPCDDALDEFVKQAEEKADATSTAASTVAA